MAFELEFIRKDSNEIFKNYEIENTCSGNLCVDPDDPTPPL